MSLINQLKLNYPSLIVIGPYDRLPTNSYKLFRTQDEQTIGIENDEINDREIHLLSTFLQPIDTHELKLTKQERLWKEFLEGKTNHLTLPENLNKVRFIFFSLSDSMLELDSFQEALQSLFPRKMPLIWRNDYEGIIIEEFLGEDQEPISFDNVIDVLISDFYTKMHFFISEDIHDLSKCQEKYNWSYKCFELSKKYQLGKVVEFQEVIPYVFINALSDQDLTSLQQSMLLEVEEDKELLRTIRVFLEAGSNTTLASKLLFMHRNSLQYRVDKFIEKTGVDVKQFDQAAIVYLLLLHSKL
ncbi:PucR family transcriptional regulator [Halobacillus seohaensis]|uniref:PucR family transcriptional regulator n=1 Tax=Halobacillus seohaensis TaxID=447421 RepID=A0ABW2EK28_9BACI